MRTIVLTVAVSLLSLLSPRAIAQLQMSAAQKEVWAGEERYCRAINAGDDEAYMALWDDDFVGWPGSFEKPAGKAGIQESVVKSHGSKSHCESTPMAVNVMGDIAMTFYSFHFERTDKNGKTTVSDSRITHTWRRANGVWKIVGGMSGRPSER
jgi:ketosteroid isomerase-like protein